MFHYGLLIGIAIVLALISGQWLLIPLAVGTELLSVSIHATRHHPSEPLARWWWKALGLIIAIGTALIWRFYF